MHLRNIRLSLWEIRVFTEEFSPEVMEKNLSGMKVLNFGYSNGGLTPAMFEAAEEKLSKKKSGKSNLIGYFTQLYHGIYSEERTVSTGENAPS